MVPVENNPESKTSLFPTSAFIFSISSISISMSPLTVSASSSTASALVLFSLPSHGITSSHGDVESTYPYIHSVNTWAEGISLKDTLRCWSSFLLHPFIIDDETLVGDVADSAKVVSRLSTCFAFMSSPSVRCLSLNLRCKLTCTRSYTSWTRYHECLQNFRLLRPVPYTAILSRH